MSDSIEVYLLLLNFLCSSKIPTLFLFPLFHTSISIIWMRKHSFLFLFGFDLFLFSGILDMKTNERTNERTNANAKHKKTKTNDNHWWHQQFRSWIGKWNFHLQIDRIHMSADTSTLTQIYIKIKYKKCIQKNKNQI